MAGRGHCDTTGYYSTSRERGLLEVVTPAISNIGQARFLPPHYRPGSGDVVCHKGLGAKAHIGNRRFKTCIVNHLRSCIQASSKAKRSAIISDIVASIRDSCDQTGGGFVRYDDSRCLWYEVGDKIARDKVGQALRDVTRKKKKTRLPKPLTKVIASRAVESHKKRSSSSTATKSTSLDSLPSLCSGDGVDGMLSIPTSGDNSSLTPWEPGSDHLVEWFERDMQEGCDL